MLGERIAQADARKGFILDGYPRTRTQVQVAVTNPTEVDGLVEVSFRYRQTETVPWWLRRGPQADDQSRGTLSHI